MSDLPLADEMFDIVVVFATIHHADNLEGVFQEIYRVTAPGGMGLIVGEPERGTFSAATNFGAEAIEKGINEHSYTYKECRAAAHRCGFTVRTVLPASIEGHLEGTIYHSPTKRQKLIRALLPRRLRLYALPLGYRLIGSLVLTMSIQKP